MNSIKHLAIIMDGNGRWAKMQNKRRSYGHEKGARVLLDTAKWAKELEIETLTFYAFSTENWKRSEKEVKFLLKLPILFFDKYFNEFINEGIKVNIIGNREPLPQKLKNKLEEVEDITKDNKKITVNIALNYGGRDEIINATKNIVTDVINANLDINSIDENTFENYLYTKKDSNVDLVIRTGSEQRVSNFLLWQIAYSELYYTDTLWPDFTKESLQEASNWFNKRQRRFGGVIDE